MNRKLFFMLVIGVIMTLPTGQSGTPDYGRSLASNPTIQSYDAGEDTTRLLMGGGANSRSGRWLWATGFESSVAEFTIFEGTLDTQISYQGNKSAKLQTNPVANSKNTIAKYLRVQSQPNAENKKIGHEFMFKYSDIINPLRVEGTIMGVYRFTPRFYLPGGALASIWIETGAIGNFVKIADVNQYYSSVPFHYIKIVGDDVTGKYSRLIFDNIEFDVSQYPGISGFGSVAQVTYEFSLQTLSNNTVIANFDNWIITGDEP